MRVKMILPALTEAKSPFFRPIKYSVEWAIQHGIETATFHILTPYPGTGLHARMEAEGRITTENWDLYDTRRVVFRLARMSAEDLEAGYWRAYRDFYRWGSIFRGAATKARWTDRARHVAYAGGWKKLEPMWDAVIRAKRATNTLPVLEEVLSGFGRYRPGANPPLGETMDTVKPTPIRRTLPIAAPELPLAHGGAALTSRPPLLSLSAGEGEPSEGAAPRFIPLALAIDMDMTPPIGSIRTTPVDLEPTKPARPVRRHLRLLPSSGS